MYSPESWVNNIVRFQDITIQIEKDSAVIRVNPLREAGDNGKPVELSISLRVYLLYLKTSSGSSS
jgi:hypothetical protein